MKETKTINNVTFNVHHVSDIQSMFCKASTRTLSECYQNPSQEKRFQYKKWLQWFAHTADYRETTIFGVHSFNTFMFTLDMVFYYEGHYYYAYITPTRKELYCL